MTFDPGKITSQAGFEPEIFRSRGGCLNHLANEAGFCVCVCVGSSVLFCFLYWVSDVRPNTLAVRAGPYDFCKLNATESKKKEGGGGGGGGRQKEIKDFFMAAKVPGQHRARCISGAAPLIKCYMLITATRSRSCRWHLLSVTVTVLWFSRQTNQSQQERQIRGSLPALHPMN